MDHPFDDDELGSAAISSIEERSSLQRMRADGANVRIDVIENTSLRRYVNSRRDEAITALENLAEVDPNDVMAVAKLQHVVSEYLNVRAWILGEIEGSVRAHEKLQQDHDGENTYDID